MNKILVIPKIEIFNGSCCESIVDNHGFPGSYSFFSENPYELCKLWRRENAKALHVFDVNSVRYGDGDYNREAIAAILDSVEIPLQVFANYEDPTDFEKLFDKGAYRAVLGDIFFRDDLSVEYLLKKRNPLEFAVFVSRRRGKLRSVDPEIVFTPAELTKRLNRFSIERIVFSDDDRIESGKSPDYEFISALSSRCGCKITLCEGVDDAPRLWELRDNYAAGADSIIIGKALYENKFPCQQIWREIESELESQVKRPE